MSQIDHRLSAPTVVARLQLLDELLVDLRTVGEPTPDLLRTDRLLCRALERILTHLVDLAVDLNRQGTGKGAGEVSRRASFDAAAAVGMITPELAERLVKSVDLQTALAGVDLGCDLEMLSNVAPQMREDYLEYAWQVADWVARQD